MKATTKLDTLVHFIRNNIVMEEKRYRQLESKIKCLEEELAETRKEKAGAFTSNN